MEQVGLYSDSDGDHELHQEFMGSPHDRKRKWLWRGWVFQQGWWKPSVFGFSSTQKTLVYCSKRHNYLRTVVGHQREWEPEVSDCNPWAGPRNHSWLQPSQCSLNLFMTNWHLMLETREFERLTFMPWQYSTAVRRGSSGITGSWFRILALHCTAVWLQADNLSSAFEFLNL